MSYLGSRHQFRANWFDYNEGLYFVTICCKERKFFLGNISNGLLSLSDAGLIAKYQITELASRFTDVDLISYTVMPNHLHLVLSVSSVGTHFNASEKNKKNLGCLRPSDSKEIDVHFQSRLSVIIRSLKGGITRECKKRNILMVWQSRYHEHIIKNQKSLDTIINYIDNNILKWEDDCFHPRNDIIHKRTH